MLDDLGLELQTAGVSLLNSIFTCRGVLDVDSSLVSLSTWWDKNEMLPTNVVGNFIY